jgi:hypothetical protein
MGGDQRHPHAGPASIITTRGVAVCSPDIRYGR